MSLENNSGCKMTAIRIRVWGVHVWSFSSCCYLNSYIYGFKMYAACFHLPVVGNTVQTCQLRSMSLVVIPHGGRRDLLPKILLYATK